MRAITIEIKTTNAAFEDDAAAEVARILRELADRLEFAGWTSGQLRLHDLNGNNVGTVTIKG